MALEALAKQLAIETVGVERAATGDLPGLREAAMLLWRTPSRRNMAIWGGMIEEVAARAEIETGNKGLADAFAGELEEVYSLTIDDLMALPSAQRGIFWQSGMSLLLGACYVQALIETGLAQTAITAGIRGGDAIAKNGLTREQLAGAKFPVLLEIAVERGSNG